VVGMSGWLRRRFWKRTVHSGTRLGVMRHDRKGVPQRRATLRKLRTPHGQDDYFSRPGMKKWQVSDYSDGLG
jgi:hypothetical protein